jgi:hypothetical protein
MAGMGYAALTQPGTGAEQVFSERLMGAGMGAARFGTAGVNFFNPLSDPMSAGITAGMGALGMGSLGMTGLAGAGMATGIGIPIAAGALALQYGVNQMGVGVRQRQDVNRVLRNRFGGMMGIGGGRGGQGFGEQEMGQISSMVREMGTSDIFSSTEEMTRLLDKTAQMGLYRGVQNARQFRTRFKELVGTLKEISQTMQVTLEDATQFMDSSRRMGFFSGQEINRNMLQTRYGAQATGMSVGQVQQLGLTGAQMGRALGMRGRVGAGAMQQAGLNIATGLRTGAISEEMAAEATGGLTGDAAVQALAQRSMELNAAWTKSRPGQAMLAGLWDPATGGINQARMQRYLGGEISVRQLRGLGRQNIAATGGRQSEFFAEQERLGGQLQEEAGGAPLWLAGIAEHVARRRGTSMSDPMTMRITQKLMQRQGMNIELSELEEQINRLQHMPELRAARMGKESMAMEQDARNRVMQKVGIGGLERRLSHWFTKTVENPFREVGDRMQGTVSEAIRQLTDDFEGRIKTQMNDETKQAMEQIAMFGKIVDPRLKGSGIGTPASPQAQQAYMRSLQRSRESTWGSARGVAQFWGQALGSRPGRSDTAMSAYAMGVLDPRSALALEQQQRQGTMTIETQAALDPLLRSANERAQQTGIGMGFQAPQLERLAERFATAVTSVYAPGTEEFNRLQRLRGGNVAERAQAMKMMIAAARSQSNETNVAFRKVGGKDNKEWASQYALAADLSMRGGLTGSQYEAASPLAGQTYGSLETELEAYRARRGEAISAIAGMRKYTETRDPLMVQMGGDSGYAAVDVGTRKVAGARVGTTGQVELLVQNEAVMRNLNALRTGDQAAKSDALRNLRVLSTSTSEITDVNARRALVNMLNTGVKETNGTITLTNQLRHNLGVIQDANQRSQGAMVRQREQELGSWMSRGLREGAYTFQQAGETKNLERVQEIARLRENGSEASIKEALRLEKLLFEDPSVQGNETFRNLLSKVEGAEYLANGLTYTAELTQRMSRGARGNVGKSGYVVEEMLKAAGLEGMLDPRGANLRRLQTATRGGEGQLVDQMRDIARRKGGEWLEKFNRSAPVMQELASGVFGASSEGGANVTQKEIQQLAAQMGTRLAQSQRLEGAPTERVANAEGQLKMIGHLKKQIMIQSEMASALGVSSATLKEIRTGQHWFTKEPTENK